MRIKYWMLLPLLFSVLANAQNSECLNDVRKVYDAWSKQISNNAANTVYLKYATEIQTGKTGDLEKNTANIEVISNGSESYFSSAGMEIFQDEQSTVSIFSDKKLIVINGIAGEGYKKQKLLQFEVFRDSVFSYLQPVSCKTITIGNKAYKKAVFKTNSHGLNVTQVASIEFLLNESANTVKQIKVLYGKQHNFHSMTMNIMAQDLNYSTNKLSAVATSNVLAKNGQLLGKYAEYRLIDNRNKKL